MKRHPSLEPFSRDHNDGLIQARRLQQEGAAALPAFHDSWRRELRDHFAEEERLLLPLCDPASAVRLQREHREIEAFVAATTDEDARRLGRLLHDHIRWEERELFVRIQHADEATLRSLAGETQVVERKRENPLRQELVAKRPPPDASPPLADLRYLSAVAPAKGPQWGMETEDLNATLLVWRAGEGVPEHTNGEVDVLIVAVEGEGAVVVDGRRFKLSAGQTILIPKGAARSVAALTHRFAHLNVHRRRKKLAVGTIPKRQPHGTHEHRQP